MILTVHNARMILASASVTVLAISPMALADNLAEPPWQLSYVSVQSVGVKWDEAAVRAVLPPGIEPVPEITGGINLYQAGRSSAFGPYEAVYFWVDIEGYDNRDGSKARWVLQGAYGPKAIIPESVRNHYGWPLRVGGSRVEQSGGAIRSTGFVGSDDVVRVELSPGKNCSVVGGTANYIGQIERTGQIVVHEIPYIGEWCASESFSAEVIAPGNDLFASFKPVEILWGGELKNHSAAFVRPIPDP